MQSTHGKSAGDAASPRLLDLEVLDRDLFRGENEEGAGARLSLYGGQVAAQALRAAGATVPPDRLPHSLHGYFLRPGRVDRPVILHVDRDRDGGSFSARHVRAVQDGEVIFSMVASFHAHEDERDVRRGADAWRTDPSTLRGASVAVPRRGPGESRRRVSATARFATPIRCGCARPTPLPDDPLVHACAVAYVSDLGSGFGQVDVRGSPRRRTEHRSQPVVPRADPRRRMDAARAVAVEGERFARRLQRFPPQRGRPRSACSSRRRCCCATSSSTPRCSAASPNTSASRRSSEHRPEMGTLDIMTSHRSQESPDRAPVDLERIDREIGRNCKGRPRHRDQLADDPGDVPTAPKR